MASQEKIESLLEATETKYKLMKEVVSFQNELIKDMECRINELTKISSKGIFIGFIIGCVITLMVCLIFNTLIAL